MQQDRPLWLENWRFPSSNRSSVRILANIPAPKRFFSGGGANDGGDMAGANSQDGGGGSVADHHNQHHQQNGVNGGNGGGGGGDSTSSVLSQSAVIFYLYNIPVTGEKLTYASIILLITILLISTSVLTISVIITSDTCKDVIGHYLVSLAVTDLLCGTLVTPLSVYAALDDSWTFDISNSQVLCKAEAYVEVMLWTSTAYIFMWIGVDRYAALTRPSRYEIEQSPTRCKCWIVFTWVTSALLCCPTLFGEQKQAKYYKDSFLCVLDWSAVAPYSITLGVLVVAPSLISVFYTYSFIFKNLRNPENLEDNQKALLENDPTYIMTFFVILAFTVSWAPYFALRAFETFVDAEIRSRPLQFTLIWLAIGGGNWKFLIYCTMNPEFRNGLRNLCRYLCCNKCCIDENNSTQYSKLTQQQQRFL